MHPARGFTLLEILVAFVILAVVGGALMELFQGGLRNLVHGDQYSRAALTAQSLLSKLRTEPALQEGVQTGQLDGGYQYTLSLTPYQESGVIRPGLLQADLELTWDEGQRSYPLRTLLLIPLDARDNPQGEAPLPEDAPEPEAAGDDR